MISTAIQYRVLKGFDDPSFTSQQWNNLLAEGNSDVIFLTQQWQKTWWDTFGRGKLLLILAEEENRPLAIAPLFADSGMIYFVGSGGSDYLDFIGDVTDVTLLVDMLQCAVHHVPGFLGFRFYHILHSSATSLQLMKAARQLGWRCTEEGGMAAPAMDLKAFPDQAYEATRKKSLLRHEAWFLKNGECKVAHLSLAEDVQPELKFFFQQHIERWQGTAYPSLFLHDNQRSFFQTLTKSLAGEGWLRFTRVTWQDKQVAYHFGFNYKGCFFWYKPTYDVTMAKHSPGEVLLRHLLLQAIKEGADTFDFGLGDEAFKTRFATVTHAVKNIGLYP